MDAVWYVLLACMLATYVVLDGFDLGAGALHLFVARGDEERRTVLAAIGPVWDGNEVWLLASGGILVFAFPRAYAAAFSGFYLPLMMILWVLVLRGVAIELRSQLENPLWRAFWDTTFAFSSALIALVLGVALGNVLRGVPLDDTGYFSAPLFTNLRLGPRPGAIDWYTLLVGVFALVATSAHAAVYLAWKANGLVHDRAVRAARGLWLGVFVLFAIVTLASTFVAPAFFAHLVHRPLTWPLPVVALASGLFVLRGIGRRERSTFVASCAFLAASLLTAAAGLYPVLLRSTLDPAFTLDAAGAAAGRDSLRLGLWWWIPALVLAIAYFVLLFRSMRGKVEPSAHDHYERASTSTAP